MPSSICKMTKLRRLRLGNTVGAVMPMVVSFTAITTAASLYTFKIVQNAHRQAAYVAKKNHIESFKLRLMQALEGKDCKADVFDGWDGEGANFHRTLNNDEVFDYISNSADASSRILKLGRHDYQYNSNVGGGLQLIYLGIRHWKCTANDMPDFNDYPDMAALCDAEYGDGTNSYRWGVVEFALKDAASGVGLPAQYIPVLWVYEKPSTFKQCFAGARTVSCRQMGGCGYTNSNGNDNKSHFFCDIQSVIESEQGGCSFGGYYSERRSGDQRVADCHAANPITCECRCPPGGYAPTQILSLRIGDASVAMFSCVRCLDQCGNVIRVNSCDFHAPQDSARARRPRELIAALQNSDCAATECLQINDAATCATNGGRWDAYNAICRNCTPTQTSPTPRCGRTGTTKNSSTNREQEDSCERQYYEQKCNECCNNADGGSTGMGECSHYCDSLSDSGMPWGSENECSP